ncbi:MAG: lysophospholipid acyltransferase family protein [Spirochaetota bacterium]
MERKNRPIKIFYRNPAVRFLFEIVFLITFLAQSIVYFVLFQLKVHGKEKLKAIESGILVSNHCHYLDPGFIAAAVWPKRVYFAGMEKTFRSNKLFSLFIRSLGGFPIPEGNPGRIVRPVGDTLRNTQRFVHFFPEGELHEYTTQLLPFQTGAFSLAYFFSVPVIPITEVQKKRKLWPLKRIELFIGDPMSLPYTEHALQTKKEYLSYVCTEVRKTMEQQLEKSSRSS